MEYREGTGRVTEVKLNRKAGGEMLRIAVVDDEREFQKQMRQYLSRYETEENQKFQVTEFLDGLDIAENYQGLWDIIFMDIKMKHMDGLAAARKIREYDSNVILIFITTMGKYAINGYEVEALDFVVKPMDYEQFRIKMRKAQNAVKKQSVKKYLMLAKDGHKERVSTDDIFYVEVKNHNLHYVTAEQTYVVRGKLGDAEKELTGIQFARCSQSYLVNLKHVIRVEKEQIQVGADWLTLSRARKKTFLQELADYLEAGYQ